MQAVRDTVVIGASAGGLRAIASLLSRLPADLAAAILVVVHTAPDTPLGGVDSLSQRSRLPVRWAENGEPIRLGQVYLSPPDRHMTLAPGGEKLLVFYGARENLSRPSINTLFRSAAAQRDARTIAVLLSGMLDDGVSGLDAVQRCGGMVVVQDPDDAEYPDMPRNAIATIDPDKVVPIGAMAEVVTDAVGRAVTAVTPPRDIAIASRLAGPEPAKIEDIEAIGNPAGVSCPECGGPLWEVGDGNAKVYRCHIGHAQSTRMLLRSQDVELERALWIAVRTLEERAHVLRRLAREHRQRGHTSMTASFEERAEEARQEADRVRTHLVEIVQRTKGTG